MNSEELGWFNQQLAAMLREGLPLGGALRQLAGSLGQGRLKSEFLRVEAALAQGIALPDAVAGGSFPPLYVQLVRVGVRSGDLPAALTMAADYFTQLNLLWRRVKSVMFYPILVVGVGLGVSLVLWQMFRLNQGALGEISSGMLAGLEGLQGGVLAVPVLFGLAAVALVLIVSFAPVRHWLAWRLPGFREARMAGITGGLSLLLRQGCPLPEALQLLYELEPSADGRHDLALWRDRLVQGQGQVAADPTGWRAFPPLVGWFAQMAKGNLAEGMARASTFYRERANHRLDLVLHTVLPLLLVLLGVLITGQMACVFRLMVKWIDMLGSDGGGPNDQ